MAGACGVPRRVDSDAGLLVQLCAPDFASNGQVSHQRADRHLDHTRVSLGQHAVLRLRRRLDRSPRIPLCHPVRAGMLFSGYAGALIDRRGYRFAIQCGLALMALSAGLRIFDGFYMLLAGQIGIAISVPCIVTCISTLVADWFGPAEEGLFTGICTIGIFVGMALSLAASPRLVEWLGFRAAMSLLAAVAAGWALLFHFTAR